MDYRNSIIIKKPIYLKKKKKRFKQNMTILILRSRVFINILSLRGRKKSKEYTKVQHGEGKS